MPDMPPIQFATKETLRQPSVKALRHEYDDRDHVLGASLATVPQGPSWDVIQSDGHWAPFAPAPEMQRNRFGDTYMCVSFSANNAAEFLLKRLYGDDTNLSDLFLGVGSGTVRGQGNSKRAVAEWRRLNGYVLEAEYPYTSEMTIDDVFRPLAQSLLDEGKTNLAKLEFGWKWVAQPANQAALLQALGYSPLQVDVQASYQMDDQGLVRFDPSQDGYGHEVLVFDHDDVSWWVYDSEHQQFLRFEKSYRFGSVMIHAVKKKPMRLYSPVIYKEKAKPALAVKHWSEPCLIAFSGGSVVGSDLFFSLYGIRSFDDLLVTEVDTFPFPIKHLLNTNPHP